MTLNDLRKEASKYGYELVKRESFSSWVKKEPCTCGRKSRFPLIFDPELKLFSYVCPACKFRSRPAESQSKAAINWNEDILRRRNESGKTKERS